MPKLMSFTNFGASQHMMSNQECLSNFKATEASAREGRWAKRVCPWILEYDNMQGNEFPTISSGFPPL